MVMGAGEVEGGCASTLGGRGAALVDAIDESGRTIRGVAHDDRSLVDVGCSHDVGGEDSEHIGRDERRL